MKTIPAALLMSILCACEPAKPLPEWYESPTTHVCTDVQMKRVDSDAVICNERMDWGNRNYCYRTAIYRNCEKRK